MAAPKYYLILKDRITVRELSFDEFRKHHKSKRSHRFAVIRKNELHVFTKYNSMWLPRKQLDQIWKTEGENQHGT